MKLKLVSILLLTVFAFALLPWPVLHDVIADHTTEQDTHCREFHTDLGLHVEESHSHCPVFDSTSLLYDKTSFYADFSLVLELNAVYNIAIKASASQALPVNLPARAPPVC